MHGIVSCVHCRPLAVLALASCTALAASPLAARQQTVERPALERALNGLPYREIGPAIMGGRVADLAVDESDPTTFYVGFASGGVWKTTSQGMSWTPVFDREATASIGDVTLAPSNPNVIWVGTGEPQNRQSSPWGAGVYRSTDGGRTWSFLGLENTRHIARIVVHPTNPDIAWVAAVGHLFGPNEDRGVFRTDDGGATWEKVLYVDENTGAIDLVMDHGDPMTLFAAMYQRQRTPWGFSASGGGSGIHRTLDGGDTWTRLSNGLPEGELGRIGLDVYRRDGNLVYATIEADRDGRGVYRSLNRGESWEKLSDNNPRPMYFSKIRIDPNDPERIYMGGVAFQISDDGGRTWLPGDGAEGIHVDHHAIWIDPNDSNHLILGSDGGVSSTFDRAATWRHHNNLAVGQFYAIGVDMRDPYYVCGGLQDNSSWCGPSNSLNTYGIRNFDWYDVSGGDGFYNVIDPTNPDIVYTESQGGNMSRYDVVTGEAARIRPVRRPDGDDSSTNYRWNWSTPIHISHHDPATIYVGANHVLRSRDRGQTWEEASPDITRRVDRDTLAIMGALVTNQTLSRHDGVSSYGTITVIGESPLDANVIYAGTDDGVVHVTRDGGATWTDLSENVPRIGGGGGLVHGMVVSRVEPSRHSPGRVYLTVDGHFSDDYGAYVYVSEDYGETWQPIVNGLPHWSVNVIREHPRTPELLFLGSEVGVHVSVDRGSSWSALHGLDDADGDPRDGMLPTVPVDDIVIHPRENDLVVGTHGRSIWIMDDIGPLEEIARAQAGRTTTDEDGTGADSPAAAPSGGATADDAGTDPDANDGDTDTVARPDAQAQGVLASPAHLFAIRPATMWARQGGWPFWGDIYAAANPDDGVRIRYWLSADLPATSSAAGGRAGGPAGRGQGASGAGDAKLTIIDADGNVIRTLDGPGRAGIHEVLWDFRIDPPWERPASAQGGGGGGGRGGFGGTPRGPRVLPGTYTVRLDAAGITAESPAAVKLDPRITIAEADLRARQSALMSIYHMQAPLNDAGEALSQASSRLSAIGELLDASAAATDELRAEADSVEAKLDRAQSSLAEASAASRLSGAIEGITARPTADQLWQIEQAWTTLPAAIREVNSVVTEDLGALVDRVYQPAARPAPIGAVAVPQRPPS